MKLTIILTGILTATSAQAAQTKWDCKPTHYYECNEGTCNLEDTLSVRFGFEEGNGYIAHHTVIGKGKATTTIGKHNVVGFLLDTMAKDVSGQMIPLKASGHIYADKKFEALIDGQHFIGTCD